MIENGHCEISYLMKNLNLLRDLAQFDSLKFSDLIPLPFLQIQLVLVLQEKVIQSIIFLMHSFFLTFKLQ